MSVRAIQRIRDMFGEPPTPYAKNALEFAAFMSNEFMYDDIHRTSRPRPARVAASNFIVFHEVTVPDETHRLYSEQKNYAQHLGAFPARIVELGLGYENSKGETHSWTARMFSGEGTPPVLVNRDAAQKALVSMDGVYIRVSRLAVLQDRLPKSAFHYPSEEELIAIRENLVLAEQDIDLYSILKFSKEHCYGNLMKAEGEWFAEHAETIRPAWDSGRQHDIY